MTLHIIYDSAQENWAQCGAHKHSEKLVSCVLKQQQAVYVVKVRRYGYKIWRALYTVTYTYQVTREKEMFKLKFHN